MTDDLIGSLNRTAKLFVDNGDAKSIEEALQKLQGFSFHLHIDESAARSPTHQAALLTALNCGRRSVLGRVTVSGGLNVALAIPTVLGDTIAEAVKHLGGEIVGAIPADTPLVAIGPAVDHIPTSFAIRTSFDGWRGGVVPWDHSGLNEHIEFTPAGVLAGALAVEQVFAHLEGDCRAGYLPCGLSLWDQNGSVDWLSEESDGPTVSVLPADFWLIGMGHLGQAFLWTIGLLPYAVPGDVRLFLQDVDVAGESTKSTSILTFTEDFGKAKTRTCAAWAEERGFRANIVERRFASDMQVGADEPSLVLCGVDNPGARAIIEGAGFSSVFEAGLGSGSADFRLIRTHSFPSDLKAADIWADTSAAEIAKPQELPPAYDHLYDSGKLDHCGVARLAQVAVGAPFVGATAAALIISQIIRVVADGSRPTVVNLDLRAVSHRSSKMYAKSDIVSFATSPSR